ncbi:MAG TPA: hypothetical protein VHE61_00395 [Opitutaceae bacterium]|nr:hypothetical protein [Opitutaceae bacterium]
MTLFRRSGNWFAAVAAALALSLPNVRGASLYLSVVAETFGPDSAAFAAAPGKPVTYAAVDGGYSSAGDPVGGEKPVPAPLIESAMAQALEGRGYQPAATGTAPAVLLVYNWGEIRRDSIQVQPVNHLKGNDRARLLLVTRTADEKRIEQSIVDDRYTGIKMGAMTRTEPDREALQLAHDDIAFVVVSAYDVAALRQHQRKLVWQVKMTTRAIGHSMSDSLTNLIRYGAPYFGRNESTRQDLKETIVPAESTGPASPPPAINQAPAGVDAAFVQGIVQSEHAMWSGRFPND